MEKTRLLGYELEGVVKDIEKFGFDDVCLTTIKRVRDELMKMGEWDSKRHGTGPLTGDY